ncbi:hypothetical protein ACGFSB_29295 [Streptomyces sp. NPDC048441]|uniref:hypothetical protein n=1 Tax=Streptomyces sp. NPDC048441 TaxID=3365552 RepID=UPI0037185A09
MGEGLHQEVRSLRETIGRGMRDQQTVGLLAQDAFQGARYGRFVVEPARYGLSVPRGWMHCGLIFQLVADRGFGLDPRELGLEELAASNDLAICGGS